jgi:hypothetical protein
MALLHFVHDTGTNDVAHWPQKREPCALTALHCGHATPFADVIGAGPRPQP